jgi:uncharacterized membrane protein YebE (DUF533 family)
VREYLRGSSKPFDQSRPRKIINAVTQGRHIKIDAVPAELKIPREAYRVIMLMPLVYVAWADGKIQSQERKLIMSIAEERGLLDDGGRGCLERWLTHAPRSNS